jgi:uncharacterized protein YyaL (SSP411 family)
MRTCLALFLVCLASVPAPGTSGAVPPVAPESGGSSGRERHRAAGITNPLPGAAPFGASLVAALKAAVASKGPAYRPRTRHLNPDGSAIYTNRLILESSPYLVQHAHNPVNWYPWGDEAFKTAQALGRPVLLSVGYSTCHWCHVMEEESFEDLEVARAMNESYIAIKVDREERPDVDAIYMSAVQAFSGSGGWPMTVWLTPDRRPFFGGTYFPPRDGGRGVSKGLLTLLRQLRALYDSPGDPIASAAGELTRSIQDDLAASRHGDLPGPSVLREANRFYESAFDPENGGLKGAPKFPSDPPARFLLRYHRRTADPQSLQVAVRTLEKMAAGGIHDQVGGGFHRYSTDARWLVPHFEEMLYDNALLAMSYLEAFQVTGRREFAGVAEDIFRYLERDMTSPEGGFYCANDADSPTPEGRAEEGRFFTWTPGEIDEAVGPDRAPLVKAYFGVTPNGNFRGRSILSVPRPLEEVAEGLKIPTARARARLEEARELLYEARRRRPPPLRDEKILTAWNALMISALAQGSLVLGREEYRLRAEKAADFLLRNLLKDGRLRRSFQAGEAREAAFLSDYAFLTAALLDLFEATSDARWLEQALFLDAVTEKHYEDREHGGFFQTSDDAEKLLAREKPAVDGSEPSGNSIQVMNLYRLYELTGGESYRRRAELALRAFGSELQESPTRVSTMLLAADFHLDAPMELVIVAPRSAAEAEPFLERLRRAYLPNRVLVVAAEGADLERKARLTPLLEGRRALGNKATAYVCERRVCQLPTTDPSVFARQIGKVEPLPK